MDSLATIRMELGINAQQIMSHFKTNNQHLEEVVTKGIERGLKELLEDDNFETIIADSVKKEVISSINKAVMSWETKDKIFKAINDKIGEKIGQYADQIAEEVTKNLGK